MGLRLTPLAFVREQARGAMQARGYRANVFHAIQPEDKQDFPSVVYYAAGNEDESSFRASVDMAVSVRIEVRFKPRAGGRQTQKDLLDDLEQLDKEIVNQIQRGRRLRSRIAVVDDFEDELNFYRRIRTLMVLR